MSPSLCKANVCGTNGICSQETIYTRYQCDCDKSVWVRDSQSCAQIMPNWLIIFIPCALIALIAVSLCAFYKLRRQHSPDKTISV